MLNQLSFVGIFGEVVGRERERESGSSVDRGSGEGEHSTCKKQKVRSAGVRDDAGGVGRGQSVGTSKVTFRSLGFIRRLVGSHGSDCSWNITQLDWIGMGGSTQIRVRPRS